MDCDDPPKPNIGVMTKNYLFMLVKIGVLINHILSLLLKKNSYAIVVIFRVKIQERTLRILVRSPNGCADSFVESNSEERYFFLCHF